jgi:hypothetical protein
MSRIPSMPAGFSASSSGPVMNPSSDIAMVTYTRDMCAPDSRGDDPATVPGGGTPGTDDDITGG